MKQLSLEEVHEVLLNIGKEFHRICVKHDTPYCMAGGTLLGAVRHKGFIPWDDDMDFGVPREYFERLKQLLAEQLPSHMRLLTMDDSETPICNYIKIEDTRTEVVERWKENVSERFGVNIDIFPIDKNNGHKGLFTKYFWAQLLCKVQAYRFLCAKSRPLPKKILAYMVKGLLFNIKERTIINYVEKRLMTKGEYMTNLYGVYGFREIMPRSIFENKELYNFEDFQFYGPKDADAYLTNLYDNYMQLPPEEKRHIHHLNIFWK